MRKVKTFRDQFNGAFIASNQFSARQCVSPICDWAGQHIDGREF